MVEETRLRGARDAGPARAGRRARGAPNRPTTGCPGPHLVTSSEGIASGRSRFADLPGWGNIAARGVAKRLRHPGPGAGHVRAVPGGRQGLPPGPARSADDRRRTDRARAGTARAQALRRSARRDARRARARSHLDRGADRSKARRCSGRAIITPPSRCSTARGRTRATDPRIAQLVSRDAGQRGVRRPSVSASHPVRRLRRRRRRAPRRRESRSTIRTTAADEEDHRPRIERRRRGHRRHVTRGRRRCGPRLEEAHAARCRRWTARAIPSPRRCSRSAIARAPSSSIPTSMASRSTTTTTSARSPHRRARAASAPDPGPPDEAPRIGQARRPIPGPKRATLPAPARRSRKPDVSSVELDSDDLVELDEHADAARRAIGTGHGSPQRGEAAVGTARCDGSAAVVPRAARPLRPRPRCGPRRSRRLSRPPLAHQLSQQPHMLQMNPVHSGAAAATRATPAAVRRADANRRRGADADDAARIRSRTRRVQRSRSTPRSSSPPPRSMRCSVTSTRAGRRRGRSRPSRRAAACGRCARAADEPTAQPRSSIRGSSGDSHRRSGGRRVHRTCSGPARRPASR